MIKNPHGRISKGEPKEQHLSTVPKSLSLSLSLYIYIYKTSLEVSYLS